MKIADRDIQQPTKKRAKSDKLKVIFNKLAERNYIRKIKGGKKETIVVSPYLGRKKHTVLEI